MRSPPITATSPLNRRKPSLREGFGIPAIELFKLNRFIEVGFDVLIHRLGVG